MSLSSLLVQREIASIREVEEALARQVIYGGDFVTNLIETSRIEESSLMPTVAESYGLPAAPIGELPPLDDKARRVVPAEVAHERLLVPLSVGDTLVIAVAEPLSKDAEQELTFALALPIEQQIAPLFRIRQALARDFGIPIDKRIARLLQKVLHKEPRISATLPPPKESNAAIRIPPRPPSMMPPPPRMPQSLEAPVTTAAAQGTFVRREEAPPARPSRRRRGPLTLAVASEELEASAERDAIFDVLFEFARQFFDYTALFIVHGDIAEGRDAFGDGSSRDKVARIGVPLDLDGILSNARKAKKPLRARPSHDAIDPVLMADLGREGTTECIVFPIIVRTRVVALVLGDGGASGIDDLGVRQLETLIDVAAGAFERVIMRRKLKAPEGPGEGGVSGAKKKAADSVPPPPTQHSAEVASIPEDRPSAEELAAPIRDLMTEPVSRLNARTLDPTAAPNSERPPPENLLAVRRPSGAPIPREEPLSTRDMRAADLSELRGPPPSSPPRGPASSPPRRRAQAPRFEFGSGAAGPSIVTDSGSAGATGSRPASTDAPSTTRDPVPSDAHSREVATPPVHPWGHDGPGEGPSSKDFSLAPHSPKAESPPPMPVAPIALAHATVAPITDMSPQALPSKTDRMPPVIEAPTEKPPPVAPAEARPFGPGEPLFDDDRHGSDIADLVVASLDRDDDSNPVSLPRFDPDATPIAPVVAPAPEPVLSLSHRKGEPPPLAPVFKVKPMPASEQQISVAPHLPPSSHSDHSRVLPSVIVDVSSEYVALVERVLAGPDDDAEANLLRAGGYAMPAIMAKFPGPLSIEPERLEADVLPRVADCGPIIRLIASQRRTALPFVLSHVEAPDVESRFWATYLLTELVYPDAIDAAVARAFDDDAKVRRAARAALRALGEAHPQAVVDRLGELTLAQTVDLRVRAIEALGDTREALAVQVLLPLLDEPVAEVAAATQKALVMITRQDFGLELDRWTSWWEANKTRHRLEWLIDALMHDQRRLRGVASEELKAITKEYFAYYDDLPKRERERAQSRYRDWWDTIGRVRFSRAATRGA